MDCSAFAVTAALCSAQEHCNGGIDKDIDEVVDWAALSNVKRSLVLLLARAQRST